MKMKPKSMNKIKLGLLSLIIGIVISAIAGGWLTESAAQDSSTKKQTILVVCRGNIQRSVVAGLLFRKIIKEQKLENSYDVISRGMMGTPGYPQAPTHNNLKFYNKNNGRNEWENSLPTLQELGIAEELQKNKSTAVTKGDLETADLVIAMDKKVLSNSTWGLISQFPKYRDKIILFTELVGSKAGISDAAGAKDSGRHRRLILEINRIVQEGFEDVVKRLEKKKTA